ncbi:MAG: MATE family efflux transporter [Eubacterium sp.]|nr:MATE family efflux transporter [Eubacterium sp.]
MEQTIQGSLTRGPIFKVLMKLALPIMASAFLATAYSIVDMFWIGKLGSSAVAGVGIGGQFIWLSQGIATLAKMGGQIHVGQALGRGDREEAKRYSGAAIQMILLFGIAFGLVFVLFTNPLVSLFHLTDSDTIAYAVRYSRIVCGLVIFSFVNTVLTGLYTAQGNSQTPLKANVTGLLLNIVLDPLLIFGWGPFPEWGVIGAAVATVFAQIVAMAVMVASVSSKKNADNILKEVNILCKPNGKYTKNVLKMGWPNALQSIFFCVISMVLTRIIAGFGDAAVATQRVGDQLETLTWNAADGFAGAINAFVAQNFGALKLDRVRKGYRVAFLSVAIWGLFITIIFLVFPEPIVRLFFYEEEVVPVAVSYLVIVGLSQAFMCIELMAVGAISGLGSTKICSGISVFFTVLRIPMAMVLSQTSLGLDGVWWTLTITTVAKGVCLHLAFKRQCKRKER